MILDSAPRYAVRSPTLRKLGVDGRSVGTLARAEAKQGRTIGYEKRCVLCLIPQLLRHEHWPYFVDASNDL